MDHALKTLAFLLLTAFLAGCSLPQVTIHEDPLSPAEHLTLGLAALQRGDPARAADECEDAGDEPGALTCRADALYLQGDKDRAEKIYRKALKRNPDDATALNNLAWLLFEADRNLDEAEKLAARAVSLAPKERAADYADTLNRIRTLRAARALSGDRR
ncbi:tetratricopeptide repeat protein [Desulfovibrio aminophilus]|nr:tetratricopeptide repeat protein [Desulfovibrio aminophilus]